MLLERSRQRISSEILICDPEEAYVKKLAEILLLKKEVTAGVRICSSLEYVEKLLEIGNIKVLLISEEIPYETRKQLFTGKRIVLTKNRCVDLGVEETELMKYQSIEKLIAVIMKVFLENSFHLSKRKGHHGKILGIYSPVHRIGKTTFALKLGKELAEEESVLYLNLETYAGIGGYFRDEENQDLSNLLYYTKQENDAISVRVSSSVQHMGNLDYIPPMKIGTDLKDIEMQEWKALFEKLSEQSVYDTIVVDIGDSIRNIFEMIEMCDWIFIPFAEDVYAKSKMNQWNYMLNTLKMQELEMKSIYVNMDRSIRQAAAEALAELKTREGEDIC